MFLKSVSKFFLKYFFVIAAIELCLISCAVQRAPSGGPVDKTPPRILEVTPARNATLVPLDQEIEFSFSESMDRKSLERAIFIAPDPGDRFKVKWKGDRFRLEFRDSLKTNRTYVITLGTDLKDERGNSLAQSYTLAFSTGEKLSDGKITGRVYAEEKKQGVLLWAYILDERGDPDPTQRAGDYATQTDGQGQYEFSNLSEGKYRVFAIWDKDNNRFFEVGLDAIGIPSRDFELREDSLAISDVNFKLSLKDTLGPALISVAVEDRNHLRLTFDESLLGENIAETQNYRIHETKSGVALPVQVAYPDAREPKEIFIVTGPQKARTEYVLQVGNITDRFRNSIDPEFNSVQFEGSARPDSIRPRLLSTTPVDSARGVLPDSKVMVHFSEPILQESFESSFLLSDSLGNALSGSFLWQSPGSVEFTPSGNLTGLSRHTIAVQLDSVFDLFGNAVADSTMSLTFQTVNPDTFSSITGMIVDDDSVATGKIFMKAKSKDRAGPIYEITLEVPGSYSFSPILPGTYTIEGYRDADGNGEYSFGDAVPFRPAERFFVYDQEIQVRARWPNEGNDITIK